MTKNQPIRIERVANGYIVEPDRHPGMGYDRAQMHVFPDLAALVQWLAVHFPKRDAD